MQVPRLTVTYEPTDSLAPYAGNAKEHPAWQVEQIAASIEQFGFDDPVGIWHGPDGVPVIVEGHGRVLAAKRLGMDVIPVISLDHLDDDARRAYVHVHNQTTLTTGFDIDALNAELESIQGFEWGDFGFDMPEFDGFETSEERGDDFVFGGERLRTDRAYNLDLVNASCCGSDGMPFIRAVDYVPDDLIGFNYVNTSHETGKGVHFFVDDYQFERIWNEPRRYLTGLGRFDCTLTPDFSLYLDMPLPMQQWNVYRSRALGHWWQREGLTVIPTLSWALPDSYTFAFAGLEKGGTYAVSTVGVKNDELSLQVWFDGMDAAMKALEPSRILLYGGDVGYDFGGCDVREYTNTVTERMRNGR